MATAARAQATPAHLWIVGILALLWNGFGCFDYLMTVTRNPAYLAKLTPDQLAYIDSLPTWLTGAWALGVWGGAIGALLLLMRSRHAVLAFGLSLIGAIVTFAYEIMATAMPAEMKQGAMAIMPYLIVAIAAFLLWYAVAQHRKGVLR
jgi:hypothetical protein